MGAYQGRPSCFSDRLVAVTRWRADDEVELGSPVDRDDRGLDGRVGLVCFELLVRNGVLQQQDELRARLDRIANAYGRDTPDGVAVLRAKAKLNLTPELAMRAPFGEVMRLVDAMPFAEVARLEVELGLREQRPSGALRRVMDRRKRQRRQPPPTAPVRSSPRVAPRRRGAGRPARRACSTTGGSADDDPPHQPALAIRHHRRLGCG
jgi:hypothetical protein